MCARKGRLRCKITQVCRGCGGAEIQCAGGVGGGRDIVCRGPGIVQGVEVRDTACRGGRNIVQGGRSEMTRCAGGRGQKHSAWGAGIVCRGWRSETQCGGQE